MDNKRVFYGALSSLPMSNTSTFSGIPCELMRPDTSRKRKERRARARELTRLRQMELARKQGGASGIDNVHAAVSIIGRESLSKQCWECANCNEPTAGRDGSKFRCAFLGKDFGTWHYDVPNECPCKGKGWMPTKKEGGAK